MLKECGFNVYGMEITDKIVKKINKNLRSSGIKRISVKVGTNSEIPFKDKYFNYLLSWNSCYYMGNESDFNVVAYHKISTNILPIFFGNQIHQGMIVSCAGTGSSPLQISTPHHKIRQRISMTRGVVTDYFLDQKIQIN